MLTALVLQLIQCVVVLPDSLQDQLMANVPKPKEQSSSKGKPGKEEEKKQEIVSNVRFSQVVFFLLSLPC